MHRFYTSRCGEELFWWLTWFIWLPISAWMPYQSEIPRSDVMVVYFCCLLVWLCDLTSSPPLFCDPLTPLVAALFRSHPRRRTSVSVSKWFLLCLDGGVHPHLAQVGIWQLYTILYRISHLMSGFINTLFCVEGLFLGSRKGKASEIKSDGESGRIWVKFQPNPNWIFCAGAGEKDASRKRGERKL